MVCVVMVCVVMVCLVMVCLVVVILSFDPFAAEKSEQFNCWTQILTGLRKGICVRSSGSVPLGRLDVESMPLGHLGLLTKTPGFKTVCVHQLKRGQLLA